MTSPAHYPPSLYKQRYEQLPVTLESGQTVTVGIHNYVNAGIPQFFHPTVRAAFLKRLHDSGVDMDLRVDAGDGPQPVDPSINNDMITKFARYVFAGKGSPEHCQIVLQLADHWGLAPGGPQAYADSALGLDCNGFVGNYLWHVVDERPWSNMGEKDADGPDTSISGYFDVRKGRRISSWDELKPGRSYILGRTDPGGNVIDKVSGGDYAHIVITEPGVGRYTLSSAIDAPYTLPYSLPYTLSDSDLAWGFRPNHLRTWTSPRPLSLGDPSLGSVYVVESTASAKSPGLIESWYVLKGRMKHHVPGVFDLFRESMAVHQRLWFQIAEVG